MYVELIRGVRWRLHGELPAIAVIGPRAADAADSLFGMKYKNVWQREEPEAVLSLYQPGRLFDAIILAHSLERFCYPELGRRDGPDPKRAFDQIDASLADPGLLCVCAAASAFTDDSLAGLLAGQGYRVLQMVDAELWESRQATPIPPESRAIAGIFERREGKRGGHPLDYSTG